MKLGLPKNPVERIIATLLAIICVVITVALFPFHYHPVGVARRTQMLSQLKQIGSATFLYTEDYDNRLPHASTMSTFRAQVIDYTKTSTGSRPRPDIFKEMPDHYTQPQFNFNLAGVKITNHEIPLLPSGTISTEQATLAFTVPVEKESNIHAIVIYADTHARAVTKRKPFSFADLLGPQFNRPNITLAPADYLADHDPLK